MNARVYLRALEPDDYKLSVKWRNDDEIISMVGGPKHYVSQERERQWVLNSINNNDKLVLAICLVENDKYIGNIMMQEVDYINRSCHIPILIGDKNEWNKGYATEARMILLKFAFDERGMERVFATVVDNNQASIRMHQKCGYKVEGIMRNAVFKGGKFHDLTMLAVLKDDFEIAYQNYIKSH